MKKTFYALAIVLGCILFLQKGSFASGKLYARFPNWVNSPVFELQIKKFKATVEIQDQLAIVHLDETFYNSQNSTMEGVYFLDMPEGSKITELYLWINGERVKNDIKPRDQAVQEYQEIVRRSYDPLLAEEVADNQFRLRLFPLPPLGERRIEVTYIQPLPFDGTSVTFLLPLILQDYDAGTADSVSIHIDLKTQTSLESVTVGPQVPENLVNIQSISGSEYTIDFVDANSPFTFDFDLRFTPAETPLFSGLSYLGTEADGFFLLWAHPPESFFVDEQNARQIVFCVDVSASMIGDKLTQVKQALVDLVQQLTAADRFNLIAFNTEVTSFRNQLVNADSSGKAQAIQFIGGLSATGLTNLNSALLSALNLFDSQAALNQIILLSDGQPTAGETNQAQILSNVRNANQNGTQIFPMGIGPDVDANFFDDIANQNGGRSFYLANDEDLSTRIPQIFAQIISPVLTDITIVPQGFTVYDVFPTTLPNLARNEQLQIAGRYLPPGTGTLTLQAKNGSGTVDTTAAFDWQSTPENEYVSRFWAAQKIRALQEEIDHFGENQELVDAIILLSTEYSVLSRYTAFLVVEPATDVLVSVDETAETPETFSLQQNYPNPFNPQTTIKYSIGASGCSTCAVRLEIYNLLGELVRLLVDETKQPGEYTAVWDGRNDAGEIVPSGIYVYKLKVGDEFVASRRMLFLK